MHFNAYTKLHVQLGLGARDYKIVNKIKPLLQIVTKRTNKIQTMQIQIKAKVCCEN